MLKFLDDILDMHSKSERIAIESGNAVLFYSELSRQAYTLARLLRSLGASPNEKALIFIDKSINHVIATFGALKSGCGYAPVDHTVPSDRLSFIVENCRPRFIVTDHARLERAISVSDRVGAWIIVIDYLCTPAFRVIDNAGREVEPDNADDDDFEDSVMPDRQSTDLAYIIYTSGSTGIPKGVMISHESVVLFVESILEIIGYSKSTRYLNVSPLYFDASVVDIFCTLCGGGTVVLMPEFKLPNRLLDTLVDAKITDTLLVSSILQLLVSRFANLDAYEFPDLRTLWYGAEACPTKTIAHLKQKLPNVKFIHGYGPTEATHTTSFFIFDEVPDYDTEYLPIGKPLPNIEMLALNDRGERIAPGQIGELYISGRQLFIGYCNDEERTASVLVSELCGEKPYYKTGDYVSIDTEGNYFFKGRQDDMIKLAGQLVCLTEIETALLAHESVRDAFVVAVKDALFNNSICALVVPMGSQTPSVKEFSEFILDRLPKYMLPSKFLFLSSDDLPRSATGKVSRSELMELVMSELAEAAIHVRV